MVKARLLHYILFIIIVQHTLPLNALTTFKINKNTIELNSPIIQYNNHYYLPIRDSLKTFKSSLTKSQKTNTFTLSMPHYNINATIKPRRKDFSINGNRHYLPIPILFINSRLHVPIPEFFNYLGFKVFINPPVITVIPKKYTAKNATTATNPSLLTKLKSLPFMEKDRPLFISYAKTKVPIDKDFFYKNNILFANILPFFKALNYTFETTKTGFLLSKKHHTIQFFVNKNTALSQFINHQKEIFIAAAPIKKNNTYFLPLESTINAFFYALNWNAKTRTIQLLSIINDIDFIRENDRDILQINSTHPISFMPLQTHPWAPAYTLSIPNSTLMLKKTKKTLDHPILKRYSAKQLSPTSTEIKITGINQYIKPYIKRNNLGIEINFISKLTHLSQVYSNTFKLTALGPITPTIKSLTKQKKVILDVPYTQNNLPNKIKLTHNNISQIRTSQFKTKPQQSRIVFDLKKSNLSASVKQTKTGVTITFKENKVIKKTTHPKPKPQVTQKKTQSLKKSYYSKSSSLKGKVIVIDAGHGGKDPGAVSLKRYQEKFFTLDIANRLQKKLARQGAVIIMTRKRDRYRSLQSRAYIANKNKADIFISIHVNSFLKSSVHGTETYYYKYKDRKLAAHLQKQLIKDLKSKNLKTKRARLYVLRHTKMPAALIEPLFLTNPRERKKIIYPQYRQKIANSIYQGISNYFKYN